MRQSHNQTEQLDFVLFIATCIFTVVALYITSHLILRGHLRLPEELPLLFSAVPTSGFVMGRVLLRWKTRKPSPATWFTLHAGMMATIVFFLAGDQLLGYFLPRYSTMSGYTTFPLWVVSFYLLFRWYRSVSSSTAMK